MVGLGQRIRLKYAHSFPTAFDKTSYTFEHTWKDRTRESAASYTSTMSFHRVASRDWCRFAFGFFGGHQPVHYEVAAKGKDEELRFFDNCPVYEQEVERNLSATAQHDFFATSDALTQAQRHLQDALHIPSLTLKDLSAIYDACAFDVAVHGIFDHWCTLMPLDVLQVMEYWKELKQYYRKSHGNSMSVAIASPLLRDVVEAMVNFTTSPNEYGVQGHFRFAHAETLLPLLSLLGFQSNDPKLLATATPPYDRHFRSAELAPFGGNVAFVLYRCTHDRTNFRDKYMLVILAQIKAFAKWIGWTSIVTSGEYGNPPQFVCVNPVYLVSLIAMKVVVTILVYILYIPLATGSTYIFSIFSHHRHAELVVVMILGPCVVNIIQFWVLDNYLKHAVTGPPASPTFARVPSIDDLIDENHPHTPLLL
ncbi:hypothetical protein DYB32_007964 [Aphanomyces invadans]|uniref:Multiple inositol polyphosphate phosphatase 1 n=1 Tax=Aphanomyces invadans TaxID=157072 RepID=A0A3R6VHE5_9STRA|nr:hypothetical protein DYB32_007964 [Aphanomyces invadans]